MGNLTAKTSGEIASFMSPSMTNIKSLKVHFSPKQLGTGDPSPENVREIEGWDGVEVNGCGKNLFDKNNMTRRDWYYYADGLSESPSAISGYFLEYIHVKPNTTYYISGTIRNAIYLYTFDKTWIKKYSAFTGGRKFTTTNDCFYIRIQYGLSAELDIDTIQLEEAFTSTPYELYQGTNLSYQWKLPDEYQEVEYIENNDNAYLDLNYIPTGKEIFEISFSYIKTPSTSQYLQLFGCRNQTVVTSNQNCWLGISYNDILFSRFGTVNITNPPSLSKGDYTIKVDLNNTELKINNDIYSFNGSIISDISNTIYLGYLNAIQSSLGADGIARYKYFKIFNNKTIIKFLIPCYRKSDGEIGMYDTVSQTFYTNQGTGEFLKGDDVFCDTAYGGYIDLISGELVEEWGMFTVDEPDSTWRVAAYNRITINFPRKYIFGSRLLKDKSMCTILPENHTDWNYGYIDNVASVTNPHALSLNYTGNGGGWSELFGEEATNENVKEHLQEIGFAICATLAEPITHQLTPTQLKSFVGQNNFWSNADYVEVEYDLIETIDIQKAKQKIILNQPQLKTISDKIVSFNTDMVAPMKNCKIYFNPIQLGSGDPSPTNVRDINGWTGLDSYVNGDKISVDWTSDAGTVYGGYIDLAKGELVAEWVRKDISEMSTINAPNSSLEEPWNHRFLIENWDYDNSGWDKIGGTDNFIIDNITNDAKGKTNFTAVGIGNSPIIYIYDNTISTIEEFKTKYSGHYICYETKFPIHYSLTPQQLLTFKGKNNIWSETNGQQIDVKYWTHKNLTPVPLINYLENQTWVDSAYISSSGKKTTNTVSASHFLTNQILLEAGTYVLSGFSYYVGSDSTRYRIHAYDSTGKWLKQITFQQIDNLSPVDISFTLDTDTYVNVSIAMDFDGVLAKIN